MAATQAQIDALKRLVNQAEIYLNVQKPATGTPLYLMSGVNAGKPPLKDSATEPATWVGTTSGGSVVSYKPEYDAIEIEQATGKVAPRMKGESVTVEFMAAEAVWENIKAGIGAAQHTTVAPAAAIANPTTAPTGSAASGTTPFGTGNITVKYGFRNARGTTTLSNALTVAVTSTQQINITVAVSPPGGCSVDWYVSPATGDSAVEFYANNDGSTFSIVDFGSGNMAPVVNTTALVSQIDLLTVGGQTFIEEQCVALVSEIGSWDNGGPVILYEVVCIYNCLSTNGVEITWKRTDTRMVKITLTGYADVTRNVNDQLYQHYQMSEPA